MESLLSIFLAWNSLQLYLPRNYFTFWNIVCIFINLEKGGRNYRLVGAESISCWRRGETSIKESSWFGTRNKRVENYLYGSKLVAFSFPFYLLCAYHAHRVPRNFLERRRKELLTIEYWTSRDLYPTNTPGI